MSETRFGIPFIDPCVIVVSRGAIDALPADLARGDHVAPVSLSGRVLTVAIANPLDFDLVDKLRFRCGMSINVVIADADRIRAAVRVHYGGPLESELGPLSL